MSEPSTPDADRDPDRDRLLKLLAVVVGAFVLLYSVLVVQQVLAAVALLVWVFVVYLVWRFVRAHERLAAAAEAVAADRRGASGRRPPVRDEHTPSASASDAVESDGSIGSGTPGDGPDDSTGSPSEE